MHTMTREEWLEFVLTGTRTGKLAATRANGSPHVTPVWFTLDQTTGDGDHLIFTTAATGVKGRALRRDPRFAVCVDDERPPYSFVLLEGEATLSEDLDELRVWATRLGARYMGEDAADAFGRRNAVPGEILVRGRITKVTAHADLAG